jgi:hypothetical protein
VQLASGIQEFRVSAVIDASGTWSQPSPMGANGLPALGELEYVANITYGMPDVNGTERGKYSGKKVLVVGAGHSAVGSLLALAALAEQDTNTRVVWAVRGQDISKVFGGGEADGLPARGALGLRLRNLIDHGRLEVHKGFKTSRIDLIDGRLRVTATDPASTAIEGVDQIVVATGARPDHSLSRELRTEHDPWLESTVRLAPLIDPNEHSCGSVRPHGHRELSHPETGFYAIGAKSYGRAPNFLMATGYEQARSVVAALAGDMKSADMVELELPQTGVCSSRIPGDDQVPTGGCCGPAPLTTNKGTSCCGPVQTSKVGPSYGSSMPTQQSETASNTDCGGVQNEVAVPASKACCV